MSLCPTPRLGNNPVLGAQNRSIEEYYQSTYKASPLNDGRRINLHKGFGNYSHVTFGDHRMQQYNESLHHATMRQSTPNCSGIGGIPTSLAAKYEALTVDQRRRKFEMSMRQLGERRVIELEENLRDKLQQRTRSGPGQLRKNFKYFDRNADGVVSVKEFSQGLEIMGIDLEQHEVITLFGRYDVNHDGVIDFGEFVNELMESDFTEIKNTTFGSAMRSFLDDERPSLADSMATPAEEEILAEEDILRTFKMIDKDRSGSIDKREFARLTRALGANMSVSAIDEAMTRLDTDGSGLIEYNEFEEWWLVYGKKTAN